ncbi:bicaudal D-related protein homolog isoform X2 [Watersipora subatra]|uniref:bicaudal D-related protein homolog isoform X2 n=1 Tax=Watersipora subatra TaxID=2589382 RepID=UPI00355B6BC4
MTTIEEVWRMLEEKENDLQLAGELGKVLLEKNEELTRDADRAYQDHQKQLEKMKSENIWLKNQLSKHSVEWDDVMKTHNEDIQQLREQLSAKAKQFAVQSQTTQEITQLAQQNQRLAQELEKVLESEELVKSANKDLRRSIDEFKTANASLALDLDTLVEKESVMRRKCQDAEQKVTVLNNLNDRYNKKCDELTYRNSCLEKEKQEAIDQVRVADKHIEMLKEKNTELFEQLQELAHSSAITSPSVFEELEYSQKSLTSGYSSNLSLLDELDSDEALSTLPVDNFSQLKMEVLETYQELQAIVDELEASECAASSPRVKVTTSKDISNGELISMSKHVRYLVTRRHQMGSLLAQIAEMKSSLASQSEKMEMLESDLGLARRTQVAKQTEELEACLKEEREEHDATVTKLKTELQSTKADNRKLEKELLETIQKKVKLSQQVEQWQLDMEEMVENQVRCMFLLEQQNNSKVLNVGSTPNTPNTPSNAGSSSTLPHTPAAGNLEGKQKTAFNRSDKRRFSFFQRRSNKDS